MCNVAGILVQGHMPVMWNVCILVVMVTFFIALSVYKIDMRTYKLAFVAFEGHIYCGTYMFMINKVAVHCFV